MEYESNNFYSNRSVTIVLVGCGRIATPPAADLISTPNKSRIEKRERRKALHTTEYLY